MTTRHFIVRLKVTLKDVEPAVVRRLLVPLKIRLDRLHLVLQVAMGWSGSDLYAFRAAGMGWGALETGGDDMLAASNATLLDVIEGTGVKTLQYIHGLGDHWDHLIEVEKIYTAIPGLNSPWMVSAEGRCPPEDVGGPRGYAELIAATPPPDRHRQCDLSPTEERQLCKAIDHLAEKWGPPPWPPRTRPLRP